MKTGKRPMRPPSEKRKAAPTDRKGGWKFDSFDRQIDDQSNKTGSPFRQETVSYSLVLRPVAVAMQFGFCHAVYVRHPNGQQDRRGLYESAKNASIAAQELNRLFAQEMAAL